MIKCFDTNLLRSSDFGSRFVFMHIRRSKDIIYLFGKCYNHIPLENVKLELSTPNLS